MEIPTDIPPGFFDSLLSGIPEEFRPILMIGLGLMALAFGMKIIGAALKAIVSIVVLGIAFATFVFVSHHQGWVDWPFYDGETVTVPDIPEVPDLDKLPDLPTLPN